MYLSQAYSHAEEVFSASVTSLKMLLKDKRTEL